jgi:mRNA-degrading endonuclease RelE of RelBE toxin-antitoxin system
MKISASEQVQAWLVALSPEPRKRVRLALRDLAAGKGDIQPLKGELGGWCRLRVGGFRIIFRHRPGKTIQLDYADTRDVVYENFLHRLSRRQAEPSGETD